MHGTEKKNAERGPHILPNGSPHNWSLEYHPDGPVRGGTITVTFDRNRVTLPVPASHQSIGAQFNRFGIITTQTDGNGQHIYFDDLAYTWSQTAKPGGGAPR